MIFCIKAVFECLQVNEMDMHGVTREDAVLYLLNIQDFVNLIVQHLKEGKI